MGWLTVSGVYRVFVSPYHCLLSHRLTGCLVIRFLSGGRLTIEITQFPLFFGQFALPVTRLLAGPVTPYRISKAPQAR